MSKNTKNTNSLKYNYHDSNADFANFLNDRSVEIIFKLYEVFYPDKPKLILRIREIWNIQKFLKYPNLEERNLKKSSFRKHSLIGRIDRIQFDTKRKSERKNVFLYWNLDSIGSFRIHCKSIEELYFPKSKPWSLILTFELLRITAKFRFSKIFLDLF
ncbi:MULTISPECIES: hypothetical protein [Leptospira]|uniref:Uncharacterized protein n=1 Tax=Leptospira weilii str. 2006001853 TaxID=1001589 RepID=A0A828Z909_9LEPT|nr:MULTISPECIES: hypothetical protein [Leptospira]EKR66340.1 hypothetical protein LEP1GSC036_3951 [Leptospira weilii str. 2006001853]EMJ61022.1 hypothetical protein LEP1GSC051_2961 [Leptospira sp. P2653]EMN43394.1 hypothetical protein LEP1GSC086_1708 [Leptospira weilii str. LNT 1234]QDK23901.1 hypothetical protein FHG67_15145 [Leptospira weilii]QDK26462.1 hypothetical protein FHG68_07115 [Leptospira weilii]